MVAIPVDFIEDVVSSYLQTRDPKGGGGHGSSSGGKSSGSKSKGSKGGTVVVGSSGGGGGGGRGHLAVWEIIVIVVVVLWTIYLLCLWAYFAHREKKRNPNRSKRMLRAFGYALMFALFITPIIWAFKKIIGRFQKNKGSYAKVDEDQSHLVQNHDEPTWYAGAAGDQKRDSTYEPMGYGNSASPRQPLAPSPMTSRDPSPAPQPPPYADGGAAQSYYAPPPVPPPAVAHQYYDPLSR